MSWNNFGYCHLQSWNVAAGVTSWCSETRQNLMILSTEWQLQLSMDSA